jgi:hypothetical protein
MDKFQQATTDQLYFRDPDIEPPPRGTSMLLLNPGGVCVIGVWDDTCIGWCPKPKVPKALRAKHAQAKENRF